MQVCSASVFLFSTCLSSPRPSFLFKHTSRGYYLKGADQENLGKVLIPVFCFLLKKNTWDTKGRMIWFSGSLLSSQIVHWVYLLLKKCLVFGVLVLFIFQLKRHSWCFWKKNLCWFWDTLPDFSRASCYMAMRVTFHGDGTVLPFLSLHDWEICLYIWKITMPSSTSCLKLQC